MSKPQEYIVDLGAPRVFRLESKEWFAAVEWMAKGVDSIVVCSMAPAENQVRAGFDVRSGVRDLCGFLHEVGDSYVGFRYGMTPQLAAIVRDCRFDYDRGVSHIYGFDANGEFRFGVETDEYPMELHVLKSEDYDEILRLARRMAGGT